MAVRKTESRIPDGYSPGDLGESASAANPAIRLVSYLSSPLAARRLQNYVVFVTDATIASTVASYEWTFNNGGSQTITTTNGVAEYTPQNTGSLTTSVNLKNGSGSVLHSVTLTQQVVALNEALELRIDTEENNFPGAAHPDTSREMINDLRLYINSMLPLAGNELYNKMVSCLGYSRALGTAAWRRNIANEELAVVLNANHANFWSSAKNGIGVCQTRPQLLAMFLIKPGTGTPGTPYIHPLLELASGARRAEREAHEAAVVTAFNTLTENNKIDLFNLLRFPKSHFSMAKVIFDGLESRYFPAETISQTLTIAEKVKKLVTEYENGLMAFSASGALTTTTFSTRVQNLMAHAIWNIPVVALAGAAGGGGAPPSAAATVGIPEKIPDVTFIADASPNDNGFLRSATVYHESYDLSPRNASSFEDIVDTLNGAATPIQRLRIVSHFALSGTGTNSQIFIPFFNNHRDAAGNNIRFTNRWYFKYGISDEEGLRAYFENEMLPAQNQGFLSGTEIQDDPARPAHRSPIHTVVFKVLQGRHDASLTPFGLQNRGNPNGNVLKLIKWCADLFTFNNSQFQAAGVFPVVPAQTLAISVKNTIHAYINGKIDAMATGTGVFTAANINGLRTAITGLTLNDLPVVFTSLGTTTFTISGSFLENHDVLRARLGAVRNRLNDAFVDIRGCRVGQDRNYMRAVREFFGNTGHEPVITAPDWFQSFPVFGFIEAPDEANIDTAFSSGYSSLNVTAADIQREYSGWSGRVGINSQLSFWNNLFNGDKFDFIRLSWRNQLPPAGMEQVKLTGLGALTFPDVMGRLKEIFFLPAATAPTAADLSTFHTNHTARVTSLQAVIDAVAPMTTSTPEATLQVQLTSLTAIATATGQTLPAAPSPVTLAHLQTCITQLKLFFVNQSNITPLMDALKAKCSHQNAGIRYMLGSGLSLPIQSSATQRQMVLMFLSSLRADAMKSFMKLNWEAPLPAGMITAINNLNPVGNPQINDMGTPADKNDDVFNDTAKALQVSVLAIDHADTQVAFNPDVEFHNHIITEP